MTTAPSLRGDSEHAKDVKERETPRPYAHTTSVSSSSFRHMNTPTNQVHCRLAPHINKNSLIVVIWMRQRMGENQNETWLVYWKVLILDIQPSVYLARRTLSMEQLFSQGLSNGDSPKGSAMAIATASISVCYCAPPRLNDQKC